VLYYSVSVTGKKVGIPGDFLPGYIQGLEIKAHLAGERRFEGIGGIAPFLEFHEFAEGAGAQRLPDVFDSQSGYIPVFDEGAEGDRVPALPADDFRVGQEDVVAAIDDPLAIEQGFRLEGAIFGELNLALAFFVTVHATTYSASYI
jgi:hypothetical protein